MTMRTATLLTVVAVAWLGTTVEKMFKNYPPKH